MLEEAPSRRRETMMLALADADTGRLLHILSLAGSAPATALTERLGMSLNRVCALLHKATALGVVRVDQEGRYRVEPIVVTALALHNRAQLLGEATVVPGTPERVK